MTRWTPIRVLCLTALLAALASCGCAMPGPADPICFWRGTRKPVVYSEHYGHFPTLWQEWPDTCARTPYMPVSAVPAYPHPSVAPQPNTPMLHPPTPVSPMPMSRSPSPLPPVMSRDSGDVIRGEPKPPSLLDRIIRIRGKEEPAKPPTDGADFYRQPQEDTPPATPTTPNRSIRVRQPS